MACVLTFNADDSATTYLITPDTYTTGTHTRKAVATRFPIDSGAVVADHMILEPKTLALEMVIAPVGDDETVQPPHGPDRPRVVWEMLSRILASRTPFRADVGVNSYPVCVLLDLAMADTAMDAFVITCQIQEILIVNSAVVPAFRLASGLRHGGKRRDRGNTPAFNVPVGSSLDGNVLYQSGTYIKVMDAPDLATTFAVVNPE